MKEVNTVIGVWLQSRSRVKDRSAKIVKDMEDVERQISIALECKASREKLH